MFHAERYPSNWSAIRAGIRLRANNRCEQCLAPNGEVIVRGEGSNAGSYMLAHGEVFDAETGAHLGYARGSEYTGRGVRVVLTVAHLDHDETHNDPANLRALCQMHHLRHDARDNARRRRANADSAAGQGALFEVGS